MINLISSTSGIQATVSVYEQSQSHPISIKKTKKENYQQIQAKREPRSHFYWTMNVLFFGLLECIYQCRLNHQFKEGLLQGNEEGLLKAAEAIRKGVRASLTSTEILKIVTQKKVDTLSFLIAQTSLEVRYRKNVQFKHVEADILTKQYVTNLKLTECVGRVFNQLINDRSKQSEFQLFLSILFKYQPLDDTKKNDLTISPFTHVFCSAHSEDLSIFKNEGNYIEQSQKLMEIFLKQQSVNYSR